jgi:hypothetical protein
MMPPLDQETPRCVDMLAPALRRGEQLPIVWDMHAGLIAIVMLGEQWPADDTLKTAIIMHRLLGRGVLALAT